ncbi:MAG TPA: hypothetical protein VHL11_11975 [Phototrophicaceae bacterium]|jgi:hypothetical protein|nr:hypothetical protein [Phototrophicaceae bacterium]
MIRIVNPYNLDDSDDAVFSGLLAQGLIWIEEDDVVEDYGNSTDEVLEVAQDFLRERNGQWVNFSRLCQHLHQNFYEIELKHLGQPDKKYKSLLKFFADYPSNFDLRQDNEKKSLYLIRLKETH